MKPATGLDWWAEFQEEQRIRAEGWERIYRMIERTRWGVADCKDCVQNKRPCNLHRVS